MSARIYAVTGTRSALSDSDKRSIRMLWLVEGLDDPESRDQLHHGACPTGVDRHLDAMAGEAGYKVVPHYADWNRYGPAAGPIRNRAMLDEAKPERLYALPRQGLPNKGTRDCIEAALDRGIDVLVMWLPAL